MLTRLKKYWFYVLIGTLVIVCTGYYGSVFGQYKELNFTNEDSLIVFLVLSLFFIMFILYFVLLKKVVSLERIIRSRRKTPAFRHGDIRRIALDIRYHLVV